MSQNKNQKSNLFRTLSKSASTLSKSASSAITPQLNASLASTASASEVAAQIQDCANELDDFLQDFVIDDP